MLKGKAPDIDVLLSLFSALYAIRTVNFRVFTSSADGNGYFPIIYT
jgi:hypothetical protein